MTMDDVDHYAVLGLPSGEEGEKLSEQEIKKAYRAKALELHPDKRPDDPNAHEEFLKLQISYEVLTDDNARKLFHHLLQVKREKLEREQRTRKSPDLGEEQPDAKRRKQTMKADLKRRQRAAAFARRHADVQEVVERIPRRPREEKIAGGASLWKMLGQIVR